MREEQKVAEALPTVTGNRACPSSRVICSSVNILVLIVALVLAIMITTFLFRCFVARARLGKKTSGQAAERQRQIQLDSFLNQAQLDIEYWTREMEREEQRREEEEESVPPPYSKHPRLPSWTEHERLRVQEEGQGQRMSDRQELGEAVNSPSRSQTASAKETRPPLNAEIRYPPPSYLP